METADIARLASLARINLKQEEMESLQADITAVLSYVDVLDDITADITLTKKVGARHNVFREDVVTNEANACTKTLLHEAPHTQGRFLKVKKILEQK